MSTTRLGASGGQPELNTLFQFDNSPAQQLPADGGSGFHFGFFGSLDLVVVAFLTKADHLLLKFLLGLAHAPSVPKKLGRPRNHERKKTPRRPKPTRGHKEESGTSQILLWIE